MSQFLKSHEEEMVVGLYDRGIIKFGNFKLKSGRKSPIYYNQRPLMSLEYGAEMALDNQRKVAKLAIHGYAAKIEEFKPKFNHLYGIPQAATAIGSNIAYEAGSSYLWGRVGKKDYGKHEGVEGSFIPGEKVVQIDDVVTNADSKLESAANLQEAGLETIGFVVMFDREEGGSQAVEEAGYSLSAVTGLSRAVSILAENNRIDNQAIESLHKYHAGLRAEGVATTFSYSA